MRDHVGTVVAERYELVSVIGQGGHGIVYRAMDRTTRRGVAVKMLSDGFANEPEYAARLAREQEALVALAGTSAVAVYDLCRAPNGSLCLVMELLDGIDLEKHLTELEAKGERLSLSRLSSIIEPIVDTLERAHDAEILHRDLKPANIFLLSDGEGVRLFDFGLSRKKTAARLTVMGTIMGSPSYIAPEVWKGRSDELDSRVDVYSLGVILFRALSGRLPFEGNSLQDSYLKTTTAPRPSLHALRPDLPRKVDEWVKQALAVDRTRRFETVRELWNALLRALSYVPPPRPMRPVADSLVNAWRAAATAFRRFIPGPSSTPHPPSVQPVRKPSSIPSRPPDTGAIDEGWMELADDEIESTVATPASEVALDDPWEEVTDAELDRPSLAGTTASVSEWSARTEDDQRPTIASPATILRGKRKGASRGKPAKVAPKPATKKPKATKTPATKKPKATKKPPKESARGPARRKK
jgi:serine/threonine protein kinase